MIFDEDLLEAVTDDQASINLRRLSKRSDGAYVAMRFSIPPSKNERGTFAATLASLTHRP